MVGFTRIYSDKPGLWSDKFPGSTSGPCLPKLLVASAGAPVSDRLCASLRCAMVGFVTDVLVAGVSKADWKSALRNRPSPTPCFSRRGIFFHCNLVYFGLFQFILLNVGGIPRTRSPPTLDLGLANPPRHHGAKFGVCPALRDEVSPELGSWRLEAPRCRAPLSPPRLRAPCFFAHFPFFILPSSFSHRAMDIDGPWQKILKISFVDNQPLAPKRAETAPTDLRPLTSAFSGAREGKARPHARG